MSLEDTGKCYLKSLICDKCGINNHFASFLIRKRQEYYKKNTSSLPIYYQHFFSLSIVQHHNRPEENLLG